MKVNLKRVNGVLKVEIDGQILEPLSFKSFRPTAKNISDFASAGVKLFSILSSGLTSMLQVPYSLYGESWIGPHQFDFSVIDKQIELFRQNAPGCYFALMVQLDTRPWWLEAHPECANTFTHLSQTAANMQWRQEAAEYLQAVLTHVEEKYGDIFYGYFMLCGFTTEWFSHFDEEAPSALKEEAFKEYMGDRGAEIPSKEELDGAAGRAFAAESCRQNVTDYRRFHAELIAESVLYFAARAQEILQHKKLLGVYYGYLLELDGPRLWNDGHLAYEKVFTSPDIDMISSPSSYDYRKTDSTSAFMVTYDTLNLHDKLYYLEFDHITHLAPPEVDGILIPGGDSKYKNQTETLDVMQRDFMLCAAKGAALWWFDMFEGWFYSKEMMDSIGGMIKIAQKYAAQPQKSVSEVLVIASGEALYGVNKNSGLNTLCLGRQREGLARMGAPYDLYSMCDLEAIDLAPYKLVIFLDAFALTASQRQYIHEKVKTGGRTVLWIYAPDYLTGGLPALQSLTDINIVQFIGEEDTVNTHFGVLKYDELPEPRFFIEDHDALPLGIYENTEKVALGIKKFGSYTSCYSAVGNLSGSVLRHIAQEAGVHIYAHKEEPVYVNSLFSGIYSLTDTELTVKEDGLYEDVFTGMVYEAKDKTLCLPYRGAASRLLVKKGEIL